MRRLSTGCVLTTICLLAAPVAAAPAADGNDWLSRCEDATATSDSAQATYCFSYARGLADGLSIWTIVSPATALACIPTGVQGQQLLDAGTAFVKSHPEMRHLAAGVLLTYSFVEAWPCSAVRPSSLGSAR